MLYPQMNKCRSLYSLDGIWQFYADRSENTFDNISSCDLPNARNIAVPASWNDQYEDLFQFHGKGIYKKEFDVPQMWHGQEIYIRFGSVSGKAKVWINGKYLMEHIGTALPFEAVITPYLKFGEKKHGCCFGGQHT